MKLETEHVKEVYEQIASHFSQTRYKPWPVVDRFFASLKPASVGVDVGCGNGKNMRIRPDLTCIGFDLCKNLLNFVESQGLEAVQGNMLSLPFKSETFDFVLSIAAIHHLGTMERRRQAVEEMARVCRPGGRLLIFAWALEQPQSSALYRRQDLEYFEPGSRQDVLVPWHNKADGRTHHRYYHLFKEGELEGLRPDCLELVESGYDKDNWFVIFSKL